MNDPVQLIGLDFGTTTSSAVVAEAGLSRNSVTGRMDLEGFREVYRSDLVFTPLVGDRIDEARLAEYLETWLALGQVRQAELFGGGALLTGLTAQADNALALVRILKRRLGDALVARANDPCMEAWLAFHGNCGALSRAQPETWFVNLDVGGGTTNLALGCGGEVVRTGCLFVGARHVQVEPGSYQIVKVSRFAQAIFNHLGICRTVGEELGEGEREKVLDFYVHLLQAAIVGRADVFADPVARLHQQVDFRLPEEADRVKVTFSGGVGELVYGHMRGQPWPDKSRFGDLGIDLARRIVACPLWSEDLRAFQPTSGGRATVVGLLRHSTEISGSTFFLPYPERLPLPDLPIFGTITPATSEAQITALLEMVRRSPGGGCLLAACDGPEASSVRQLGQTLGKVLANKQFPAEHPLVLLVRENVGKILGQYVTAWGTLPFHLVVIDEVAWRSAQFVHIGALRNQVLPVSFFGIHEPGLIVPPPHRPP